jgi:hypothetical protein
VLMPVLTNVKGHPQYIKAYILSLTAGEDTRSEGVTRCSKEDLAVLQKDHENLERQSQAVFTFCRERRVVGYWGQEACVARARHLVERKLTQMGTAQHDLLVAVKSSSSEEDDKSFLHTHSLSPGAESSHDSCYDSDGSPSASRRSSYARLDANHHDDVSRTVSETLAAELLADDKPLSPTTKNHPVLGRTASLSSQQTVLIEKVSHLELSRQIESECNGTLDELDFESSPDWLAKLEKTLKLGYSEEQLRAALHKLGSKCTQNELLNELVQMGTTSLSSDEDVSAEDMVEVETMTTATVVLSNTTHTEAETASTGTSSEPPAHPDDATNLRPIVIDGSNVAMNHGNKEVFSCYGIKLAVDWFKQRGHKEITVFVPQWRKEAPRADAPTHDQDLLLELEREKVLVFTPTRWVRGKRIVCYDDRYIIKLAAELDGVVVSNDNYRDLLAESPAFQKVIEERLLMFSFVTDR